MNRTASVAAAWLGVLAFSSGAVGQEVAFEVIHVFEKSARSTEGAGPGKLSLGPDGALYGTAGEGGPSGAGTVFRMTLGGAIGTLHAFSGRDGMNPDSCLLLGADGAFYGTTSLTRVWGVSRSTVFRITPQGQFSEVYVYPWNDEIPATVVIKGSDGQAYEVSFGQNISFQLIGDKRFAEALPTVSVVNRERSGEPLPIKALFSELPSEPVSMTDPPPVTFSGRAKRPLCGVRVADLYGRVWGSGGGPLGVGAMALGPIGKGPENGLIAWFFPPGQPPQKNPDFAKVFNIHGQYVPSVDGGVYVLAGDEIVQINREGHAPAVASIAALLDGGTGRGQLAHIIREAV